MAASGILRESLALCQKQSGPKAKNLKAQGIALIVPHKFSCVKRNEAAGSGFWAEGVPGHGEEVGLLETGPECLSSGVRLGANHVAAKAGDQPDHFVEARRC